jgi:hypothetical protein
VATGWLAQNTPGFPGYSGELPLDAPTIAETLRAAGYATAKVGKWHNAPNSATPNPAWPSNRGFDRFYGFLTGETGYFFPARIMHNTTVAPIDEYLPGYYATDDWTDKAIGFATDIRNHNATQPFLLYVAYNAVHGPLQAKVADFAKYRGRYDAGWDVLRAERFARQTTMGIVPPDAALSDRDPAVPAWDSLPADQRRLFAHYMEAYAAILDCADRSFTMTLRIAQPTGGEGVLFALGDVTDGLVLSIEAGQLHLFYNGFGEHFSRVGTPVAAGSQTVAVEMETIGRRRARCRLHVGASATAPVELGSTFLYGFHEGVDIGLDGRGPVSWDIKDRHCAFRYTVTIRDLVINAGTFALDSTQVAAPATTA